MPDNDKPHVVTIGGVYLYSKDAEALAEWYRKYLGIDWMHPEGANGYFTSFEHKDQETGKETFIGWAIFNNKERPEYTGKVFRINYSVKNIKEMIKQLQADGFEVTDIGEDENGMQARTTDPDGNMVELWEDANRK